LYFVTPTARDFIWPIAGRFPVLSLLTLIVVLRMPQGWPATAVTLILSVTGVASISLACRQFVQFEARELGDLDGAIASIPPRQRVASVVGDQRSHWVNASPFLHVGSYYQLEKGGVVAFTFAGFPHWPVAFKPGREPPTGPHLPVKWEWHTHGAEELFLYYDYVLTRDSDLQGGLYQLHWVGSGGWIT